MRSWQKRYIWSAILFIALAYIESAVVVVLLAVAYLVEKTRTARLFLFLRRF